MWYKSQVHKNSIITDTGKSVLIALPHKSEYDGFAFWHPSKLVREGKYRNTVSISYNEDFVFRLKKYGKGKYNCREIIDEIPLAADEIDLIYKSFEGSDEPEPPLIYTPEKLEPENTVADESLIDYE